MRQLILTTFSIAVLATGSAVAADMREACHGDIARFCKGVTPGGGAIAKCLKSHEAELSPECKVASAETKEKVQEVHSACKNDIEKYCKEIHPGEGRIAACLKANQDRLTPQCKAAAASMHM